ncbi:MAG TPA: putative metal-binding motif-containing protein, partial [Kofleriaceae bacterium]|nr:putative metal-binding motif-containing protein [Kofleriaceae bacterium]
LATILVAGCSDRTGVLLDVTRDEATVPAQIDGLRFFIGVQVDQSFIDDGDPAATVAVDPGRDLLSDPYSFLLTRGELRAETPMMAVVVAFKGDQVVGIGKLDGPIQFLDGKVTRYPVVLQGTVGSSVTITETGCLVWSDGTGQLVIESDQDRDCDGDPTGTDCDDANPAVGHTSPEVCNNGNDDDCDGSTDEVEDFDSDGVDNCLDCDDTDGSRFPGNPEVCDGVDNDCNDVCDDGELDFDGDSYTVCSRKILDDGSCSDVSDDLDDCDDGNDHVHPFAAEVCDGVDNDCSDDGGACDQEFDGDSDTYTTCGSRTDVCDGISTEDIDCEPELNYANPGITAESCDDADDDCDGILYPDSVPCYGKTNTGGEDICKPGTRACDDGGTGWTGDCVVTVDDVSVPLSLCDAYNSSTCQDAPDPYACANQTAATMVHSCTVLFPLADPGNVCPLAARLLPNTAPDNATCAWLTAPARNRASYDVVMDSQASGATGSTSSSLCQPMIVVRDTLVNPQQPDSWVFMQQVNGVGTQLFRVDLTPMGVAVCPANGLSCATLAAPN